MPHASAAMPRPVITPRMANMSSMCQSRQAAAAATAIAIPRNKAPIFCTDLLHVVHFGSGVGSGVGLGLVRTGQAVAPFALCQPPGPYSWPPVAFSGRVKSAGAGTVAGFGLATVSINRPLADRRQ